MKGLYVLLILFIGVVGCSGDNTSSEYSKEIKELEGYLEGVDSVEEAFLSFDSLQAVTFNMKYEYYKRILRKFYVVDSIDVEFARRMTLFKAMKNAKAYPELRQKYIEELSYTRSQLKKLIETLENVDNIEDPKFDKNKIPDYIALEKKGAQTIIQTVNSYTTMLNTQKIMYDTLNPYIEPFVDSIVQANGLEK